VRFSLLALFEQAPNPQILKLLAGIFVFGHGGLLDLKLDCTPVDFEFHASFVIELGPDSNWNFVLVN